MKKTKLWLSLAVAVAVVTTAATSFAAWDTLSATSSGKVTLNNPITVATTSAPAYAAASDYIWGNAPVYSGEVEFTTANVPGNIADTQLTLAPVVMNGDTNVTDQFDIVIKDAGVEVPNKVDSSVSATNTYTVELTPKDTATTLAGTELKVEVTATLAKKGA